MSDIQIDIQAVESAHSAMLSVRDTIGAHCAQHNQVTTNIEHLLSNVAGAVFNPSSPLHGLDPLSIWERWGFGGIAHSCAQTHSAIEHARGTSSQIAQHLGDTHRGQLTPILLDRASDMQSSLGHALESLWTINSMLHPGNIVWLLESSWNLLEHFFNARGALDWARQQAQEYCDYLARLAAGERELIDEIIRSLQVGAVEAATGLAGVATGVATGVARVGSEALTDVAGAAASRVGQFVGSLFTLGEKLPGRAGKIAEIFGLAYSAFEQGKVDIESMVTGVGGYVLEEALEKAGAGELGIVYAVGTVVDDVASWGLSQEAGRFVGGIRTELLRSSQTLATAADHLGALDATFQDVVRVVIDSHGTILTDHRVQADVAWALGQALVTGNAPAMVDGVPMTDMYKLVMDSGHAVMAFDQSVVALTAAVFTDSIANSPLHLVFPSASAETMRTINDVAQYIVNIQ